MAACAPAFAFRCEACGACCNSPPRLSLPELFRHQDLFVGCLAIHRVERLRPGARLSAGARSWVVSDADAREAAALADGLLFPIGGATATQLFAIEPQGYGYPSVERCPALGEDHRCTLHAVGKPATCAAVPLDALVPDRLQHLVLAGRLADPGGGDRRCIAEAACEGRAPLTRGAEVVDASFREALACRRDQLAADRRMWAVAVADVLRRELFSDPARAERVPIDGFFAVSVVPALLVIAGASPRCLQRCLEYLDAQLRLLEREVAAALRRGRKEDRPMTDRLRAWAREYGALRDALRADQGHGAPTLSDRRRREIESWLGVDAQPPLARETPPPPSAALDPADEEELAAEARRLGIRPRALRTYLDAGAGRCAAGVKRSLHAAIKAGGAACNLDCTYCYYLGKRRLLRQTGRRMDDAVLEKLIADYIRAQDVEEIAFTWHGGEPTLLGLEFFRKVVALQARYAPAGRRVVNDVQTNGTLLDDAWCAFLAEHGFLVGLSVDGPRHLHDVYRRTRSGRSSSDAVVTASHRLRQHGVRFATLTTVNRVNATMPLEVYRFLRDEIGTTAMQFIPCVEPLDFEDVAPDRGGASLPAGGSPEARPGHPQATVANFSVDPDDWGRFLCAAFDEWAAHDVGRVKVNLFETTIAQLHGRPALICSSSPICGKNVAVEHDGRVYACDHFVYPDHEIGNIGERSMGELVFSSRQLEFGLGKLRSLPRRCRECAYLELCWGECPRTRILRAGSGEGNVSYLCPGWRRFFHHAVPLLERMEGISERS